jgi:type IV/VI secretion system ImpK/VasF family protein
MPYQWSLEPAALTELASGVLGRIVEIRARQDFGSLQTFQDECLQLFAAFDDGWRQACAPADPQFAGDPTKYALASWLDEIVAESEWPHRHAWESRSLELQLFGTDRRGKDFYHRLDRMMKSPDAVPAALLVYYTCLLAGFRGQYRHDDEQRAAIIEEVRERLVAPERVDLHDLVPPVKGGPTRKAVSPFVNLSQQIQWASGALLVLLIVIYIVLQWNLRVAV